MTSAPAAEPGGAAFRIRGYASDDEEALVALWELCGLVRPSNDPRREIARKVAADANGLLVARSFAGELVGSVMVGYEGHRGWINYLGVHPAWRRSGIGRALMAAAETRLRPLGCPKINLQVRSSNREVLAFYAALGFQIDDVVSLGRRLVDDAASPI